ncbi:MAG: hypothetical protein PHH93_10940 [Prolixibacteraceae bacterium]|nr:hypothetical protein [Prolixibacteraceae bacterium]
MGQNIIMMILFGTIILAGGIYFLIMKAKNNKNNNLKETTKETKPLAEQRDGIKRNTKDIQRKDMSSFIRFDKIANDMIYQKKGERYTMVIQCKGINYELMSEIEQLAIEEGFVLFLNTLKFPIQLYVQTRTIDLNENIKEYKARAKEYSDIYTDIVTRYNEVEDDIDASDEQIEELRQEKLKYSNITEYITDITRYIEKMALNKYMLQRNFYVVLSYNKSEIATTEKFTKEEYEDLCYRELYTRAQGIMGSLISCSVVSKVLNSNELAQLIYISLNRDDERAIDIKKALDAGFYRLYTTADDVREKKQEILEEEITKESIRRVEETIRQAIEEGIIIPEEDMLEMVDKEVDKRAIKAIERSSINSEAKQKLKDVIVTNRREKTRNKAKENEKKENEKKEVLEEEGSQEVDSKDETIV